MAEWKPIETAPRDGEQILLWDGGIIVIGWFDDTPQQWRFMDLIQGEIESWPKDQEPAHWMPLPDPPEARE